jgi:hypothetical protein
MMPKDVFKSKEIRARVLRRGKPQGRYIPKFSALAEEGLYVEKSPRWGGIS